MKKGADGDWNGYRYSGTVAQAGIGLNRRGSGFALEYKFTYAKPKIEIADGYGVTAVYAHHLLVGWSFEL